MAFWGIRIPGNGCYTLPSRDPPRRLRITNKLLHINLHASTVGSNLDFLRLEVKVGENQPISVAIVNRSTELELEFEESNDVLLSVVGPTHVYLVGYYYQTSQGEDSHNPKIGLKNNVSIHHDRDIEPNREKSMKNVVDMDTECNVLEETDDRKEPKVKTSVNEPQKRYWNRTEIYDSLSDSMESNVLEETDDRKEPKVKTSVNESQKRY